MSRVAQSASLLPSRLQEILYFNWILFVLWLHLKTEKIVTGWESLSVMPHTEREEKYPNISVMWSAQGFLLLTVCEVRNLDV